MKNCPICHSKPKLSESKSLLHPYARELSPSFNYNCHRCQFITLRFNHTIEQAREEWNKEVENYLRQKENSKEKNMMQISEIWALNIESRLNIIMAEIEDIKEKFPKLEEDHYKGLIGKWGFVSDNDPECPDNNHLRKLVSINTFHQYPYQFHNISYKYFRPASYEELNRNMESICLK